MNSIAATGQFAPVKRSIQAATGAAAPAAKGGDGPPERKRSTIKDPLKELLTAVALNDSAALKRLLMEKSDPNGAEPRTGCTPLFVAAEKGNDLAASWLLQFKADANHKLGNGDTPLIVAARNGKSNLVDTLAFHKADVNSENDRGKNALSEAVINNHAVTVERLISHKVDVNETDETGQSVLDYAIDKNKLGSVESLLKLNANCDYPASLLLSAAKTGRVGLVSELLNRKVDPDYFADIEDDSALLAAVKGGHVDVVNELLSKKADIDLAIDEDNRSLMCTAASVGNLDVIRSLVQAKADVS